MMNFPKMNKIQIILVQMKKALKAKVNMILVIQINSE